MRELDTDAIATLFSSTSVVESVVAGECFKSCVCSELLVRSVNNMF